MEIGIVGTGRVARGLARRWVSCGWNVTFGSRDPEARRAELVEVLAPAQDEEPDGGLEGSRRGEVRCRTIAECLTSAPVQLLALPWSAIETTLGPLRFVPATIVVDCINPLRRDLAGRDVPCDSSTLALLTGRYPEARWVKAFNCASSSVLEEPAFPQGRPSMPYCGNDADACRTAVRLIEGAGFEPIDCGGADAAPWLETVALLTIRMAIRNGWKGDCAVRWERR